MNSKMSGTFLDALQMGGASATILAVMFGVYKLLTLAVNHRCRSDCCGRFFSLGIQVVETTPPPHRHVVTGEATLNHRLLDGFQTMGMRDDTPCEFHSVSLRPLLGQSMLEEESRNHPSVIEEDRSSPAPTHLSTAPPTEP
jgi:hypothetical protein